MICCDLSIVEARPGAKVLWRCSRCLGTSRLPTSVVKPVAQCPRPNSPKGGIEPRSEAAQAALLVVCCACEESVETESGIGCKLMGCASSDKAELLASRLKFGSCPKRLWPN